MAEIIKIVTPMMDENAYIVYKAGEKEAIVIDPSFNAGVLLKALEESGLACRAVFLTHGHFDHIAGVRPLREKMGAAVYIHEKDADMLTDAEKNMSVLFGINVTAPPADYAFQDGADFLIAGLQIKAVHTPGHSAGGSCYLIDDALFTGDTLFNGGIGRTDFPGCGLDELAASLQKLAGLKGDYILYPGHGESSSLDFERANNPYMGEEKWFLS